jgi:hypothetical protein
LPDVLLKPERSVQSPENAFRAIIWWPTLAEPLHSRVS